jgi:hypothetical protein
MPRRKGVRTVQNGRFAGGSKTACIGRVKREKYSKVIRVRHMRAGQEREIYSNLVGDRQELHSSSLVSPIRSKGRGQKKVVWRVGAGDSKKKGLSILFLGHSGRKLTSSAFHRGVDFPLLFTQSQFFRHLAQQQKNRVLQGTVVLHMQYPARVTTNLYKLTCFEKYPHFHVKAQNGINGTGLKMLINNSLSHGRGRTKRQRSRWQPRKRQWQRRQTR